MKLATKMMIGACTICGESIGEGEFYKTGSGFTWCDECMEMDEGERNLMDSYKSLRAELVAYATFHTAIDEMFQEIYGANLGELFVISSIPSEHRHIFDTALEALGALNEAVD